MRCMDGFVVIGSCNLRIKVGEWEIAMRLLEQGLGYHFLSLLLM